MDLLKQQEEVIINLSSASEDIVTFENMPTNKSSAKRAIEKLKDCQLKIGIIIQSIQSQLK